MNDETRKDFEEWYSAKEGYLFCRLDFALEVVGWATQRQKMKDAEILRSEAEYSEDSGYDTFFEVYSIAEDLIRSQE